MTDPVKRARPIARATRSIALLVLLPVALALICAEVWAWVAHGTSAVNVWSTNRFDPTIGFLFKPNAKIRWSNGLDYDVTQKSNASGFLDRPFPKLTKPAGTCRVAFVGDSMIEALQVPIKQKVQFKFETRARMVWPDLQVETMAVGFSGTGQLNQLTFYDRFVKPRRPDVVVLVFVNNDFANNSALLEAVRHGWHPRHTPRLFARRKEDGGAIELQPIDPDWRSHQLPVLKSEPMRLHGFAYRRSRIYHRVYDKLSIMYPAVVEKIIGIHSPGSLYAFRIDQLSKMSGDYAQQFAKWGYPDAPGLDHMFYEEKLPRVFQNAIEFTGFAFDQFKQRTSQQGARLVVLATYGVKGRYLERLRGLLAPRGIALTSQHEFLAAKGVAAADVHFRNDGHWSETGHRRAAEQLVEFFANEGLCGAS